MGRDAGEQFGKVSGVKVTDDIEVALRNADVLIDFTRPEASMMYLDACQKHHVKMVIGTTGFSPEQKLAIEAASKNISIVFAPNMSVGVTLYRYKWLVSRGLLGSGPSSQNVRQGSHAFSRHPYRPRA